MCDIEVPTIHEVSIVKTKKEHKCVECLRHIPKGEQVEKVDALYDGGWSHFYTCEDCFSLRSFVLQKFKEIVDIDEHCLEASYWQNYGYGDLRTFLWEAGFLWENEEILEEIDSFGLKNYDPEKGVPMGRFCLISTKAPWLKIVQGRCRLVLTVTPQSG